LDGPDVTEEKNVAQALMPEPAFAAASYEIAAPAGVPARNFSPAPAALAWPADATIAGSAAACLGERAPRPKPTAYLQCCHRSAE